ncbi:MAG TPA: DUF2892 domain-containing protein [Roseovarius sp.]
MTINMGTADRVIRAIVGLVLILAPFMTSWAVFSTQWVMYLSIVIGIILAGTAIFGMCPLYRIIGVNTCRT